MNKNMFKKKQWYLDIEKNNQRWEIPIEINEKYVRDYTSDKLKLHYQYNDRKFSFTKKYLYDINVRGYQKNWGLPVETTLQQAKLWNDEGLDLSRILNSIPAWWVDMGFSVRFWCFWQDIFNFNNPFAK